MKIEMKSYKDYNDYELVYLIKEGDELSYEILHTKYHPVIAKMAKFYYIYNQSIGLDYEDLYQEGICGLENALKDYDGNTSLFYTYAVLCIRREIERLIKTNRRQKHSPLNEAVSIHNHVSSMRDVQIEETIYNKDAITENIFISDYYSELFRLFKYELTDIQAQVYELKLNGFNPTEISILLDMRRKSVDGHLRSIKKALCKYKRTIEE